MTYKEKSFQETRNLKDHLTFSFIVILLGWVIVCPMVEEVPLSSWGTGGFQLIVVLFSKISLHSFSAIVSLWQNESKIVTGYAL